MTDRELLEKAAKAAGIEPTEYQSEDTDNLWIHVGESGVADWNPLINDGDALRLAVQMSIQVRPGPYDCLATSNGSVFVAAAEPWGEDPYVDARRAIVRAAASLGEQHDR